MAEWNLTEDQMKELQGAVHESMRNFLNQTVGSDMGKEMYPGAYQKPTNWSEVVQDEDGEQVGTIQVWNGSGNTEEVQAATDMLMKLVGIADKHPEGVDSAMISAGLRNNYRRVNDMEILRLFNELFITSPNMTQEQRANKIRWIADRLGVPYDLAMLAVAERDKQIEKIMYSLGCKEIPIHSEKSPDPIPSETEQ